MTDSKDYYCRTEASKFIILCVQCIHFKSYEKLHEEAEYQTPVWLSLSLERFRRTTGGFVLKSRLFGGCVKAKLHQSILLEDFKEQRKIGSHPLLEIFHQVFCKTNLKYSLAFVYLWILISEKSIKPCLSHVWHELFCYNKSSKMWSLIIWPLYIRHKSTGNSKHWI